MKPTQKQKQERLDRTLKLIGEGHSFGDIRRKLKAEYGIVRRTCDRYLSRVREMILEDADVTVEDHRAGAIAWYRTVLTDETVPIRYRLVARTRMDKILQLEQQQIEVEVTWREQLEKHGVNPEQFLEATSQAFDRLTNRDSSN